MSDRTHYVYVISSFENGHPVAPCKIGVSHSPAARLSTLQTGSPKKLGIIAIVPMVKRNLAEILEQCLHEHFSERRLSGEWFDMNPVDAAIGACCIAKEMFLEIGLTNDQAHQALNGLGITNTIHKCFEYVGVDGYSGALSPSVNEGQGLH